MMTSGKKVDILTTGRFAEIKDSGMAVYGIKKGSTVYLAGDFTLPYREDNPYILQKIFVCALVSPDGHIDNSPGAGVTINPKRLKPLPKPREERLQKIRDEDFRKELDGEESS